MGMPTTTTEDLLFVLALLRSRQDGMDASEASNLQSQQLDLWMDRWWVEPEALAVPITLSFSISFVFPFEYCL